MDLGFSAFELVGYVVNFKRHPFLVPKKGRFSSSITHNYKKQIPKRKYILFLRALVEKGS